MWYVGVERIRRSAMKTFMRKGSLGIVQYYNETRASRKCTQTRGYHGQYSARTDYCCSNSYSDTEATERSNSVVLSLPVTSVILILGDISSNIRGQQDGQALAAAYITVVQM